MKIVYSSGRVACACEQVLSQCTCAYRAEELMCGLFEQMRCTKLYSTRRCYYFVQFKKRIIEIITSTILILKVYSQFHTNFCSSYQVRSFSSTFLFSLLTRWWLKLCFAVLNGFFLTQWQKRAVATLFVLKHRLFAP